MSSITTMIIIISKPSNKTGVYPVMILLPGLLTFIEEHDCIPCLSTILHFVIRLCSIMLSKFICQMGTRTELWHNTKTMAVVHHVVSWRHKKLQTAEGTVARIIQAQAVRNVLNESVWWPAIRPIEWLKKCKPRTFSSAERLQYTSQVSEQDPGLTSVLMKGSDWWWSDSISRSPRKYLVGYHCCSFLLS